MRSGIIEPRIADGTLRHIGQWGHYWSSWGSDTAGNGSTLSSAYYLYVGSSGVIPSAGPWDRWYGYPLRCLSTVLDM